MKQNEYKYSCSVLKEVQLLPIRRTFRNSSDCRWY